MALPLSSITVNDGATPPVAQTFSSVNRDGMVSEFRNLASALVRGAQMMVHRISLGKTDKAANRALISLTTPTEAVVDGQTVVVRSSLFKLEANFAPAATEQERVKDYTLFLNLLNNADMKTSVTKLQSAA